MLALTVREGDYITIGGDIVVQVIKTGDTFRLAIDAPRSMEIARAKICEQEGNIPGCIRRVRQKTPPGFRTQKRPAKPVPEVEGGLSKQC